MSAYDERADIRRDYVSLLSSMAELLARNEDHYQASLLNKLSQQIASGQSFSILNTNDIWGGAGSVVDCSFLRVANSSPEAMTNESRFSELVIRLVDLLDRDGFATDLMRSRRKSYRFWKTQRERKTAGQS